MRATRPGLASSLVGVVLQVNICNRIIDIYKGIESPFEDSACRFHTLIVFVFDMVQKEPVLWAHRLGIRGKDSPNVWFVVDPMLSGAYVATINRAIIAGVFMDNGRLWFVSRENFQVR